MVQKGFEFRISNFKAPRWFQLHRQEIKFEEKNNKCVYLRSFKGTLSQDFWHFFCLKDLTWASYEKVKIVLRTFSFSQRHLRKTCVLVVNNYEDTVDYADTHHVSVVNEYADTCHHSQWLHRHHVSVVVVDTQEILLSFWKK